MSLDPTGGNYSSTGFRLAMNGDSCLDENFVIPEKEPVNDSVAPNYAREEAVLQPEESNSIPNYQREETILQPKEASMAPNYQREETIMQPEKVNTTPSFLKNEGTVLPPLGNNTSHNNNITVQQANEVAENNPNTNGETTLVDGVDYNKPGKGWLIAAILFTITGGYLAIVADIALLGNISVNGQKYHKYNKVSRIIAIISLCVIPFSILLWNLAME
jgi:hypothetical protein